MTPDLTRVMVEVQEATINLDSLERTPAIIGDSRSTKIDAARDKANGILDQLAVLLSNAIPRAKARAAPAHVATAKSSSYPVAAR